MADSTDIRNAIIMAAREAGIDPAWALAVAERESSFNPNAHSSKTIHGLFQMTKGLRDRYGIGDSTDPGTQAKGSMPYFQDLKGEMSKVLGREPTPQELYAGHHFGGTRAARLLASGDPDTPVTDVFTRYELSINPHIAKAGTVGNLMRDIEGDIGRRMAKYGGEDFVASANGTTGTSGSKMAKLASSGLSTPLDAFDLDPFAGEEHGADAGLGALKPLATAAKQQDDEPEPTMNLAPPPPVPPAPQRGTLPALPDVANPSFGLTPEQVLGSKPSGLAGALSPLMGRTG